MSVIGIDVGSSAVKAAAYSDAGKVLAVERRELTPQHSQPGWWEQDPEQVWQATVHCMQGLARDKSVRHDPPQALAISASGREVFPVDGTGVPLGPCLMGADIRGAQFETPPASVPVPEPWTLMCGHLRERMDPVFRVLWWRKSHPEVVDRAKSFLGWHEFLTLRLCGRAVTDRSLAGRWLIYDLQAQDWSPERMREYQLDAGLLPELGQWGTVIGAVKRDLADAWGIPPDAKVAVGAHDVSCAAIGAGVSELGTACLISGSYENLLIPTADPPTATMLLKGLSVTPHPGQTGLLVYAISPTGNAILNWARSLLDVPIEDLEHRLQQSGPEPSPVLAIPYLSGSMLYWEGGRRARGALIGLTLATSRIDIVKALMESIAYDHYNTRSLLHSEGVPVTRIRATGGGSRSRWWTQLKADITGIPIEVMSEPETGTLGAALLAGLALGRFGSLTEMSLASAKPAMVFEPDLARASLHRERVESYRRAIPALLSAVF
jgi:xylulokinase